jgi:HEAT repeat protein
MKNEVLKVCAYYDRAIIPYLIDALINEEAQSTRRFLMDLLKEFGNKIIPEAVSRLKDSRWFVKRNMLYILMDLDTKEVSEYIKPCCQDENPKVRITALRCLLNLRDEHAIATIRQNLQSSSEGLFEQAVTLAGSFKLKEVVDDLITLLNKHELTGADILHKISVVRALGDIADPKALKTLRRLLSSRSILFRKTADQLKEDIYKTLKNYPYDLVKDMVDSGTKSKNRVIREESLRVRNENES